MLPLISLSPRVSLCPNDIIQVVGESNYSRIILRNGQSIVVSQTLSMVEQKLPSEFIRIHKSHLINICYLAQILRRQKLFVLTNGFRAPLSRRRAAQVQASLAYTSSSPELGITGCEKIIYLSIPLSPKR